MKVRNRTNFIAGWTIGYIGTAAVIAADPLALIVTPTADWGGISPFSAGLTLSTALVANLCFMVFAKPYVEIQGQNLIVQNPLKIWTVGSSDVQLVRDAFPYPYVRVGERRIWLMSMDRSLGSILIGWNVADRIPDNPPTTSAAPERTIAPRGRYNLSVGQVGLAASMTALRSASYRTRSEYPHGCPPLCRAAVSYLSLAGVRDSGARATGPARGTADTGVRAPTACPGRTSGGRRG